MRPNASIGREGANRRSNPSAFTRAELIATLGAIFLCAAILLPALANTASRSEQAGCLNNLRQIGIAFQAWGNDHDDQRPWFVLAGGTRDHPLGRNVFIHFAVLSNYISPTVLSDPGERVESKRVAQNWSASPAGGLLSPNFQDNALSYMLGPHTTISEAASILTADRNVFFNGLGSCSYGFTPVHNVDRVWNPSLFRGWTNGNHSSFGNVLLNDGRVEYTSSQRLFSILFRANDEYGAQHFVVPSE